MNLCVLTRLGAPGDQAETTNRGQDIPSSEMLHLTLLHRIHVEGSVLSAAASARLRAFAGSAAFTTAGTSSAAAFRAATLGSMAPEA
jgi:hypothetical protein